MSLPCRTSLPECAGNCALQPLSANAGCNMQSTRGGGCPMIIQFAELINLTHDFLSMHFLKFQNGGFYAMFGELIVLL